MTHLSAREVLPAGSWEPSRACDHIVLDYDARHRRRYRYVADHGTDFVLDLPRAVLLRHGDGLLLSDGRVVRVDAEPEALMLVRAASPLDLVKLAWHIGNRHLSAEIHADHLLLRRDGVIFDMLVGLGADVAMVEAPFTPEGGAYAGDEPAPEHHHHGHGHHHHAH